MYNKKIASEFALGIIIIIAILFGGYLYLQNYNQNSLTVKDNLNAKVETKNKDVKVENSKSIVSPKLIIEEEINKYKLQKNIQASNHPAVYWKRDRKNIICLNNDTTEYFIEIIGKNEIDDLMSNITSDLRQKGFIENTLNQGENRVADQKRVGFENGNLKCTISKIANEQKKDTTKSKYTLSLSCANETEIDRENFNTYYQLAKMDIACINKKNDSFVVGAGAAFEDSFGATAGGNLYGKKSGSKWIINIYQDYPPCAFVDGFSKDIYNGLCFDEKLQKERNIK